MPDRVDPTDNQDFIAGSFLLCSFEEEHSTFLTVVQQKESYFTLPDSAEKGDPV